MTTSAWPLTLSSLIKRYHPMLFKKSILCNFLLLQTFDLCWFSLHRNGGEMKKSDDFMQYDEESVDDSKNFSFQFSSWDMFALRMRTEDSL